MLRIDPSDAVPIWKQIEEGVRHLVAQGALAPDDPVPSVREMARELRVNPLTVSKAYRQLVDDGVLIVRRGEGTFVASQPPRMAAAELGRRLDEAARRYATHAKTLGADVEAAREAFRRAWAELARGGGGEHDV